MHILLRENKKRHKTIKHCLIFTLMAVCILLNGCSRPSESEEAPSEKTSAVVDYTCISNPESKMQIYVILKNYHGLYWQKVIEGITAASKTTDAAIYLGGIDNETDISGQVTLIEQAIEQGADGILLAPTDSTFLVESCQNIQKNNIPLVLIDSSINSNDYDICYMTDNMDAGMMAAQKMISMLNDAGNSLKEPLKVGIVLSSDTSQAMVNRVSGFLEYWADHAPKCWEIAEDIFLNGGDIVKAQSDVSNLLKKHTDIKGIFGCNNTSTIGITNALLTENRTDIVMVGFDLADETIQLILDPDYRGVSLLQNQDQMGYLGIVSLDGLMKGEKSEQKYFDTGVTMINAAYLMEKGIS